MIALLLMAAAQTSCDTPSQDDLRPYTLCLAESDFERAELQLKHQWTVTLARVKARKGAKAARRLHSEQRIWIANRNRKCEAIAGGSPTTQSGRNQMACLAQATRKRTAQLKVLVGLK